MPAWIPQEANVLIVAAYNAEDTEAVLAMYEPAAVYVNGDGTTASGIAAIRENLKWQLAFHATWQSEIVRTIIQGDIAVVSSRWSAAWTGTDGKLLTAADQTIEVLRRQPDGTWLYVIDAGQASEWFSKA